MSEHKGTITIEVVGYEKWNIDSKVTMNGDFNLLGASFAIANLRKSVIKAFKVPEILVDATVDAAKTVMEQKQTTQENARDKLYELLEALRARKERKDCNEA